MPKSPKSNASATSQSQQTNGRRLAPRAISKNRVHPYSKPHADQAAADGAGWTIREICKAYNWPEPNDVAGGGTIAVIHLAGEWLDEDVARFFEYQGIAEGQQPHVFDSPPEEGPASRPSDPPTDADVEVALDIQIAGASYALATGQPATIRVYKGAQSAEGLIAALRAATKDECDVCCITWGKDEQSWNAADVANFNDAAKAAVDIGMIIVAASGDNDSSDGGPTPSNVDFPASSPYVVGCGGTKLFRPRKIQGDNTEGKEPERREEVWNNNPGHADGRGTGGGFSELFPIEDWQLGTVQARMRMVPDIAAHADPETGFSSAASRASSAERARRRRSTQASSRPSAQSAASSRQTCTKTKSASTTSGAGTTACSGPWSGPIHAPGSVRRGPPFWRSASGAMQRRWCG
jgi:hypothetical protein